MVKIPKVGLGKFAGPNFSQSKKCLVVVTNVTCYAWALRSSFRTHFLSKKRNQSKAVDHRRLAR